MGYILRIVGSELDGHVVPIPADRPITFGRGGNNDVQIHDQKLSRTHCQISMSLNNCSVTDLNSTNGTYVNGERIEERGLAPGDVVTIGLVSLKVAYREDEPTPAKEAAVAYCAECQKPITKAALDEGVAKIMGNRAYCGECRATIPAVAPGKASPSAEEPVPVVFDVEAAPEERFGDYLIGRQLRSTRFGTQYKATKKEVAAPLALTLLRASDPHWAGKLLRTCYQAGALIHPGILLLYETGDVDGRFYFTTEHIEAQSLEEMLKAQRPLSHKVAFSIADQLAHAIAYANDKHILHGALAPCNVYVKSDYTCKAGEFGLSSVSPPPSAPSAFAMPILPYRAPEQLRQSMSATIEADIYALGALLYHMLTGRPPYHGESVEEIRAKVLDGLITPLSKLLPDVPEITRKIVERSMAASPTARYQTPRELLNDFEHAMRTIG